jgi:hypothetical protein
MVFATLTKVRENEYELLEVLGDVVDPLLAGNLVKRIRAASSPLRARRLAIVAVDEKVYGWRIVRTNGIAQPIAAGAIFRTASDLSKHMGYRNNQVANRLGKAHRSGKRRATVCGVTLEWAFPNSDPPKQQEPPAGQQDEASGGN